MDSSRPADHELHTDTTAMAAIEADAPRPPARWRMIVYSAIGIVMFFVPVTINGASSIPLDHLVTWVRGLLGPVYTYDPAQIAFVEQTWWWNILGDVRKYSDARRIATHFMAATGKNNSESGNSGVKPLEVV